MLSFRTIALLALALFCATETFAAPTSQLHKRASHTVTVINNCPGAAITSIQIPGLLLARSPGSWTYSQDVNAGIASVSVLMCLMCSDYSRLHADRCDYLHRLVPTSMAYRLHFRRGEQRGPILTTRGQC